MTRTALLILVVVAALVGGLLFARGCGKPPTEIEHRADSVLQTAPAWEDSVKARDSVLVERGKEAARLRRALAVAKDSAAVRLQRADQSQRIADSVGHLPAGIAPHDSILRLADALEAQKRATVELRSVVIPALQEAVAKGEIALSQADATIRLQKQHAFEDQTRINALTLTLSQLREGTKHKGQWNLPLGIHLPGYLKDAVEIAGSAYIGYRVGRGS